MTLKTKGTHPDMHTPPNLTAALRLEGDTSSLTICRTCILTGEAVVEAAAGATGQGQPIFALPPSTSSLPGSSSGTHPLIIIRTPCTRGSCRRETIHRDAVDQQMHS
ncbi:unnamed protein product [Pleuronectes platessa]|uniref:Uncharacterized protein n=1 Tax=Pleuronectes platessa TaxID=8262 RepID=A0A9N7YL21_PLEPL|nr:unnamed protein product [Pleuronectes platessa]